MINLSHIQDVQESPFRDGLYATQCRRMKFQKVHLCRMANVYGFRSRAERNAVKRSVSAEILKFFKIRRKIWQIILNNGRDLTG